MQEHEKAIAEILIKKVQEVMKLANFDVDKEQAKNLILNIGLAIAKERGDLS